MRYDQLSGKEVESWTSMDNKLLEKIYKVDSLTDMQRRILLSLCRRTLFQNDHNVVRTSWWGARKIVAEDVGCSESSVTRAYKALTEMNIITKELRTRLDGSKCWWITINVDSTKWRCQSLDSGRCQSLARARLTGVRNFAPIKK